MFKTVHTPVTTLHQATGLIESRGADPLERCKEMALAILADGGYRWRLEAVDEESAKRLRERLAELDKALSKTRKHPLEKTLLLKFQEGADKATLKKLTDQIERTRPARQKELLRQREEASARLEELLQSTRRPPSLVASEGDPETEDPNYIYRLAFDLLDHLAAIEAAPGSVPLAFVAGRIAERISTIMTFGELWPLAKREYARKLNGADETKKQANQRATKVRQRFKELVESKKLKGKNRIIGVIVSETGFSDSTVRRYLKR